MKVITTNIEGAFILEPGIFEDVRGSLVKTFNKSEFQKAGLCSLFAESLYTISKKGVLRGMHFQTPPHDMVKVVSVLQGSITDIIVDLRKDSPTYGKHISVELSESNRRMLYVPRGFAHGFVAHEKSTVSYLLETERAAESEAGIRYDSFGADWKETDLIVSDRDKNLPQLAHYNSPF